MKNKFVSRFWEALFFYGKSNCLLDRASKNKAQEMGYG